MILHGGDRSASASDHATNKHFTALCIGVIAGARTSIAANKLRTGFNGEKND